MLRFRSLTLFKGAWLQNFNRTVEPELQIIVVQRLWRHLRHRTYEFVRVASISCLATNDACRRDDCNQWYFGDLNRVPTAYTGCNRSNVRDFGRVFLMLNYTDITQNTYIQSWTVTEIMASDVWNFDSRYSLTDYQIRIETGRNMWFL